MPSNETYRKLRIFAACPGDVAAEKDRLRTVVQRLKTHANECGFFLELLEWRDVVPDMGRPQQIIFDQSEPKGWDIFVGVLWQRFGSPSGAVNPVDKSPFESGTHEEFQMAYDLWQRYRWPRILFYQCTRPRDVNLIDPEQLARVQKFVAEFLVKGAHPGLYQIYETVEQFAELVYDHIRAVIKDAVQEAEKVSELSGDLKKNIRPMGEAKVQTDSSAIKALVIEVIEEIERLYETQGEYNHVGLPTGFVQFDQMTGGLRRSTVATITGPPGIGKTALAMNIAEHVACHVGKAVAFFTLEMSSFQFAQRLMLSMAKVDLQKVRSGFLSERDFPSLITAASQLANSKLFIDDSPGLAIAELQSKARKFAAEQNVQLIVIDYLQLLDAGLPKERPRMDNSELASGIKRLAKELNLPIVLVATTLRPRRRTLLRLGPEDFAELHAVVRDADLFAFLYRAEYYETNEEALMEVAGEAELIIVKHRNGPTGTVPLTFRKEYARFENRAIERQN